VQGKVALVTGASTARQPLRAYARRIGATVIVAARRTEKLARWCRASRRGRQGDRRAHGRERPASIEAAFAAAVKAAGAPDIVVNNAGTAVTKPSIDLTEEDWRACSTPTSTACGAWRRRRQGDDRRGQGRLDREHRSMLGLRVGAALLRTPRRRPPWCSSPRALALEWARYRIRVNAIAPGYVETDMNRDALNSEQGQALVKRVPQRRIGKPPRARRRAAPPRLRSRQLHDRQRRRGRRRPPGELALMDFALSARLQKLRARYRAFVREEVLPLDTTPESFDEHENIREDLLEIMRNKAKDAGLWAPQMPVARGGLGLPLASIAVCYEELNYALFGPVVCNAAAPDDGNMTVLNKVATEAQKERWLQPIVDGRVRSAFAMTEPHPGGGRIRR
jgi:hypothetical protein